MKLEKAIENRTAYLKNGKIPKSTDDYNATLLSIEALRRIIAWRNDNDENLLWDLSGETEE